ncbi:hypothetical protein EYF80_003102 [Liparis tanakae]|uniref:Uncharacterized protein n=1 Tax=Liparis tanakae TaxID=230148 RepID=A0A4Z2JA14_9TELE|nr:hypothetical protein EYF80_003102 [Liparis tanakae]
MERHNPTKKKGKERVETVGLQTEVELHMLTGTKLYCGGSQVPKNKSFLFRLAAVDCKVEVELSALVELKSKESRPPVAAGGVPVSGLPGSRAVFWANQITATGLNSRDGRALLTWINWMVRADFPTPPPPTTTSRYFSCTEPSFQPAIEDTSPPPPPPEHQ